MPSEIVGRRRVVLHTNDELVGTAVEDAVRHFVTPGTTGSSSENNANNGWLTLGVK